MTAETVFKRWMLTLITLFILLFSYIVVADLNAPMTSEGRVQSHVVQIAPEVSGNIANVYVRNNQKVVEGEVLLAIDSRKFEIALEQAKLSLDAAFENEAALFAQQQAATANVVRASAAAVNAEQELARIQALVQQDLIAPSHLDDAHANYTMSKANLNAERQSLRAIEAQLGHEKGQSTAVRLAKNALKQAQLDLSNTRIVAPSDGVVTNLQVRNGTAATSSKPLLTFVSLNEMWVTADFREKSLINLRQDSQAFVAFDALPGQVFSFQLMGKDLGVAAAQQLPDGSLTKITLNNRWVRDAQRTRVHFSSTGKMPSGLFVGSRASVSISPKNERFWSFIAKWQIQLVSWFHYIY